METTIHSNTQDETPNNAQPLTQSNAEENKHNAQPTTPNSSISPNPSSTVDKHIPMVSFHLPNELLLQTLLEIPFSAAQLQSLKDLNERVKGTVESPVYRIQTARRNFPELCQLFHMYAPNTIMSEEMLLYLARVAHLFKTYANIICQVSPNARKDIVEQGLYVTEAREILRSWLGRGYPIPGRTQDIWLLGDKYTAEVVRYTMIQVFRLLGRLQDTDENFRSSCNLHLGVSNRAMLRGVFEAVVLYSNSGGLIRLLQEKWHRPGQFIDWINRVMIRMLLLQLECAADPGFWSTMGPALLSSVTHVFQPFRLVTNTIETADEEDTFTLPDTFDNFWKRENDCALEVVNKFENRREEAATIDFVAIGKVLRWESLYEA